MHTSSTSMMKLLLALVVLLARSRSGFCQAFMVAVERGVVVPTSSLYPEQKCDFAGEVTVAHPMSLDIDDRYYAMGHRMLLAAHISLDAINKWPKCGIRLKDGKNVSLRLETYGDSSSINMTKIIGNTIVNRTDVDFMFGGYSSTLAQHLAPIAQAHKKLMLTGSGSRTSIYADRDHVFGTTTAGNTYWHYALQGLQAKGAKTVAFVTEEDVNTCLDVPDVVAKFNMTFLNGTVLPEYAPYETYLQVAETFAELNPDVVATCIRTEFASWNRALRAVNWSPNALIYSIVFGTTDFEETLDKADLAYTMGVASWDRGLPPIPDGATGWTPYEFDEAFFKASFERAVYQPARQAAAVSILAQAIERVGEFRTNASKVAIRNEIATGYFSTVYGNISFDANGQSAAPSLCLQYDATGTIHVVLPTSLSSATDFEMVYPRPSFEYRDCEIISDCAVTNGTCAADGTCDCENYGWVSQGVGETAKCAVPPGATENYLPLAISLPVVAVLVLVGVVLYVHNAKVNKYDDSIWKIKKKDLLFEDPPCVIGTGTFGVVVLAEYRGTKVAVKRVVQPREGYKVNGGTTDSVVRMSMSSGDESRDNSTDLGNPQPTSKQKQLHSDFSEEMRALNGLRHPTIITVLGAVLEPNEDPMLVMEYMQHGSLYNMLHNETMTMDDEVLLPILRDISSGCRYLHAVEPEAIVHGDLKSANILVDDKLRAKVADFGMATIRKKSSATGTLLWMAPELLRGDSLNSTASDVYSFGMIIWESYSRKDPYEGEEDTKKVLTQISDPKINKRPPTPKDCPAPVATLMADCLLANPMERPSFEEVDIRLKRVEAGTENKSTTLSKSTTVSLFDIFPRHVAEALRDGKKVEPEHKDQVTIFFSDIVNYTQICSELDSRKVAGMLDRLYHKLDYLSDKHGVFKVETIGDAYMAVTNLVEDQQADHAKRIAAFAIDAVKAANETLIDPDDPDKGHLDIRCGFHTGPVVADVVGSRNPRYCLFGDSVNTASRMESNSEKNRILCSKHSADVLREQNCGIGIERRGKIKVKGKGAMLVYWIGDDKILLPPPEAAVAPVVDR